MAVVVCGGTGNITDPIWDTVTNTPTIHASTNISLSTTALFTQTFTAPNTTNACKGVLLYVSQGTNNLRVVTVTLQQSSVDTAAAVTFALPPLASSTSWLYFQFPTPYVFTTTAAGAYRFKIQSASTSAGSFSADSGGANMAYIAVDDRPASAANNELMIASPNAGTVTNYTVTNVGSNTISNNIDVTTSSPTPRSVGNAITICWGSVLKMDTTANSTLISKGHILTADGGELQVGTVASPLSSSITANINMSMAINTSAGVRSLHNGKITLQGASKAYRRTSLVSGLGTAASPLVTSDTTGWAVGDELCIGTTNLYTENEYKFIRTISGTDITLADTAGGAEAGLVNTHAAGAIIGNLTRNVVVSGTATNLLTVFVNNTNTIANTVDMDWMRWDNVNLITMSGSNAGVVSSMDNCVVNSTNSGLIWALSKTAGTYTGNIVCRMLGSTSGTFLPYVRVQQAANNRTFNSWTIFATAGILTNTRGGFGFNASFNITVNDCYVIGGGSRDSRTVGEGGFGFTGAGSVTLNNCQTIGQRYASVASIGATDVVFNNFMATGGDIPDDLYLATDGYSTILFNNSTFVGSTLVNNYPNAITGTLIRFHNYNNVINRHIWYTVNGQGSSTGTGLSDTTVRTANSLAVRLAPETSDGLRHSFKIVARPDNFVGVNGFVRMNSAFAGAANTVLTVELYLPGSTVPDATQTLTKVADTWQAYNIGANYTGDIFAYASVYVRASNPDVIAGAYVYHDDTYNGTNPITALDVWDEGQPSPIQFEQLGDAAAVWAVATAGLTVAGTTGKMLRDIDGNAELAAIT